MFVWFIPFRYKWQRRAIWVIGVIIAILVLITPRDVELLSLREDPVTGIEIRRLPGYGVIPEHPLLIPSIVWSVAVLALVVGAYIGINDARKKK